MKRIRVLALTLASVLVGIAMMFPVMVNAMASPMVADLKGDAGQGLQEVGGGGADIHHMFSTVVDILSIVVGVAAVIVIIVSGLKYVTSGGDSGKVSSAKGSLIYALIGLAVAALAQFLIHFVLYQASQ